ncbi:type II toxin-antitoxin system HicA family toxin [Pseudomonas sp. NMI760_13]|uniref:type II toxin-antitoxin system HicA family toxin n=1 Tax=Pseudomonas sp. NMI760_13 TaxID=2903147 RepID=UPI001E5ED12A|nr:type II toxin-antitoxin system HicA family toxin [Pseudomonas sp. NMI760_13]MCE0915127.1 type II toxin-antitoxin system HicA family toxin [Pseudomonas sp. NMI760_13]
MKYSELRRWLRSQGATFVPAKGSHFKVYLGDRQTIFPDHGAKEMGEGLRKKILKDLGFRDWPRNEVTK